MRTFAAPHVDEVGLLESAEPWAAAFDGALPEVGPLAALAQERGIDFATAAFYQCVRRHPVHGAFCRTIDAIPAAADGAPSGHRVLVVPTWLYREHPEWGADGRLVAEVCGRLNLDCRIVETESRGLIAGNAARILDALRAEPEGPVWLVTYSKSVLEVRYLLTAFSGDPVLRRLRGWIALSANVTGARLVDVMLESRLHRAGARAVAGASRIPFAGVEELAVGHAYWRQPFQVPAWIEAVTVMGVPLTSHVQKYVQRRFARLAGHGPNDGTCLLAESYLRPGVIYPLWGADHFIRSPALSPLLYRLLTWVKKSPVTRHG